MAKKRRTKRKTIKKAKKASVPKYFEGGKMLDMAGSAAGMIPGYGPLIQGGMSLINSIVNQEKEQAEQGKITMDNWKANQNAQSGHNRPEQITPALSLAMGGSFLKKYNAPTHADGGQMVDAAGNPSGGQAVAEIEKDETVMSTKDGNYAFSPNLVDPKTGLSFAKASKKSERKLKKQMKNGDDIATRTNKREMARLQKGNDTQKQQMQEAMMAMMGGGAPEGAPEGGPEGGQMGGQMPMNPFGGMLNNFMGDPPDKKPGFQMPQDIRTEVMNSKNHSDGEMSDQAFVDMLRKEKDGISKEARFITDERKEYRKSRNEYGKDVGEDIYKEFKKLAPGGPFGGPDTPIDLSGGAFSGMWDDPLPKNAQLWNTDQINFLAPKTKLMGQPREISPQEWATPNASPITESVDRQGNKSFKFNKDFGKVANVEQGAFKKFKANPFAKYGEPDVKPETPLEEGKGSGLSMQGLMGGAMKGLGMLGKAASAFRPDEQVPLFLNPNAGEATRTAKSGGLSFNQARQASQQSKAARLQGTANVRSNAVKQALMNAAQTDFVNQQGDIATKERGTQLQQNAQVTQLLNNLGMQEAQARKQQEIDQSKTAAKGHDEKDMFFNDLSGYGKSFLEQDVANKEDTEKLKMINTKYPDFRGTSDDLATYKSMMSDPNASAADIYVFGQRRGISPKRIEKDIKKARGNKSKVKKPKTNFNVNYTFMGGKQNK